MILRRLDFLNFTLNGPSLSHSPIGEGQLAKIQLYEKNSGECDSDRLVIFTLRQQLGLSGGNQLCGQLSGQHGLSFFVFIINTTIPSSMIIPYLRL